jgi:hypothetical protein
MGDCVLTINYCRLTLELVNIVTNMIKNAKINVYYIYDNNKLSMIIEIKFYKLNGYSNFLYFIRIITPHNVKYYYLGKKSKFLFIYECSFVLSLNFCLST